MDWQTAGAIATVAAVGTSIPCTVLGIYVKWVIAENNGEMKTWINGSFMRAREVEAELKSINIRLDEHSRRFERIEDLER